MGAQKKVEDFDPDAKEYKDDNPDFELPLLSDLMGKTFKITGVAFDSAGMGDYAVIDTDEGKHRTSSDVLMEKLGKMHSKLDKGIAIRVSLQSKTTGQGTYYYFDVPA